MVGRWGMSEQDRPGRPCCRIPRCESPLFPGSPSAPSEETRELVDAEVRRIVDECYQQALELLRDNRTRLDSLAHALLERETLDERDAYVAAGFPDGRPPRSRPTANRLRRSRIRRAATPDGLRRRRADTAVMADRRIGAVPCSPFWAPR